MTGPVLSGRVSKWFATGYGFVLVDEPYECGGESTLFFCAPLCRREHGRFLTFNPGDRVEFRLGTRQGRTIAVDVALIRKQDKKHTEGVASELSRISQ